MDESQTSLHSAGPAMDKEDNFLALSALTGEAGPGRGGRLNGRPGRLSAPGRRWARLAFYIAVENHLQHIQFALLRFAPALKLKVLQYLFALLIVLHVLQDRA
jgi:hypothetical protein